MENLLMRLLAVVNSRLVDETERVIATNLLKNTDLFHRTDGTNLFCFSRLFESLLQEAWL